MYAAREVMTERSADGWELLAVLPLSSIFAVLEAMDEADSSGP